MTDRPARLTVVAADEAFSDYWSDLAERLELELQRLDDVEPVPESRSIAVVLSCPGREGHAVDLLHGAHRAGVDGPLVVGAEADHRLAVELMRRGAGAYYALPADASTLEDDLRERIEDHRRTEAERGEALPGERQSEAYDFSRLVGDDPSFRSALERAARAIPRGSATVLLTGETGTGKELVAQAIHYNGPRRDEAFVAVNCSAIPDKLLESELFGHEKGAFTDARAAKPGLFHVADGGTLFLDEIATLPLELQGKLLRVLETGEVRRVGGLSASEVDVRIIAAANVDLRRRVGEDEFREDLYYRLAVLPVHLPPLRERPGDVPLLARHFLARLSERYEMEAPELTPAALRELERHDWPGNVRELRNAVERALLMAGGRSIRPEQLALEETSPRGAGAGGAGGGGTGGRLPFPATMEELEEAAVGQMIRLTGGNKSEAARRLGIARSRLYRILRRESGDGDEGEGEEPAGSEGTASGEEEDMGDEGRGERRGGEES